MSGLMCDLGDIETERKMALIQGFELDPSRLQCVIGCHGFTRHPPAEHGDEYMVVAQAMRRVVVECVDGCEDAVRGGANAGFLQQLTHGGGFDGFSKVDLATREAPFPLIRRVGSSHQQNASVTNHHSDRGRNGSRRRIAILAVIRGLNRHGAFTEIAAKRAKTGN